LLFIAPHCTRDSEKQLNVPSSKKNEVQYRIIDDLKIALSGRNQRSTEKAVTAKDARGAREQELVL
jgi:hypothetical protein